jgi:hypothetical protein
LFERIEKVIDIVARGILDTEIIDDESKGDIAGVVLPQSGCDRDKSITVNLPYLDLLALLL